MAEETAPADAQAEQAAQVAEQEAQIAATRRRQEAADVADDAEPSDDETSDRAPRVWLIWNKDQDRRYGHIPTQGSGANGELTPDEVQRYFTRALYKEATARDPDGKRKPMYLRARKADLRPNRPYVGDAVKEETANAES